MSGSGCSTNCRWPPSRWTAKTSHAADGCGDLRAVVATDDVEARVEGGGAARRGDDLPVVDEQHIGVEADLREAGGEGIRPAPVGGGAATVQHTGGGQGEGTRAEADQTGTPGGGATDRFEDGRVGVGLRVGTVRHDDGVGPVDGVESGDPGELEEAVMHLYGRGVGAELEVVPGHRQLGRLQPEEFGGHAQLERVGACGDDHHDPVRGFLRHVRFVALTRDGVHRRG